VRFVRGDVREPGDLAELGPVEVLIECSAEPSATSGLDGETSCVRHLPPRPAALAYEHAEELRASLGIGARVAG
jgi:hypothetical protein